LLDRRRSAAVRLRPDAFELADAIAQRANQRVLKAAMLDQPSKLIVANRWKCTNSRAHEALALDMGIATSGATSAPGKRPMAWGDAVPTARAYGFVFSRQACDSISCAAFRAAILAASLH
jgi:hypothetical protein